MSLDQVATSRTSTLTPLHLFWRFVNTITALHYYSCPYYLCRLLFLPKLLDCCPFILCDLALREWAFYKMLNTQPFAFTDLHSFKEIRLLFFKLWELGCVGPINSEMACCSGGSVLWKHPKCRGVQAFWSKDFLGCSCFPPKPKWLIISRLAIYSQEATVWSLASLHLIGKRKWDRIRSLYYEDRTKEVSMLLKCSMVSPPAFLKSLASQVCQDAWVPLRELIYNWAQGVFG